MATLASSHLLEWDLTRYFPGIESAEYQAEVQALHQWATKLAAEATALKPADGAPGFDRVANQMNQLADRLSPLRSYTYAVISTDSYNQAAQKAEAKISVIGAEMGKARNAFQAWIGTQDLNELLANSALAKDHEFMVRRAHLRSQKMMGQEAEEVATELALTGSGAWGRLYGSYSSQISVHVEGIEKPLPMSAVRALAYDSDRKVRKNAYSAELNAWNDHSMVISYAMNAIKGSSNALSARRHWNEPLEVSLFSEGLDQGTLDAMLGAARNAFPEFRRYMKAKATALKLDKLAFYDLFAPVETGSGKTWTYEKACAFVQRHFAAYDPAMGDLARRAFEERWVDVEPRPGKRDGAYCSGTRPGESLVMMNFKPSMGSVSTLAHELGHAYHNHCLRDRTPLQKGTPMSLAETASTFCETFIRKAAVEEGTDAEKLLILEAGLQGENQVVVDITSRFLFEKRALEARKKGELSANDYCEIMKEAQLETYGDGLNPDELHPYMWAAKPHYYGSDFYNFPYMFGLLFGIGLYAEGLARPEGFTHRYAELLSDTGRYDAATLAMRFGIDIRSSRFWDASLAQIAEDVSKFDDIVHALA